MRVNRPTHFLQERQDYYQLNLDIIEADYRAKLEKLDADEDFERALELALNIGKFYDCCILQTSHRALTEPQAATNIPNTFHVPVSCCPIHAINTLRNVPSQYSLAVKPSNPAF